MEALEISCTKTTPYFPLSPHELNTWLSWAGEKLLAMSLKSPIPITAQSSWPKILLQEEPAELPLGETTRIKFPHPTQEEIPLMDEILLLPNLATDIWQRKILHARCLTNPATHRPINSWTKIGQKLHTGGEQVKYLHRKGLIYVAKLVPCEKVCRIRLAFSFFTS